MGSQHLRPKLTLMPQPTTIEVITMDTMAVHGVMDSVEITVITMVDTMATDGADTDTAVTDTGRGLLMLSPRLKLKLMPMSLSTILLPILNNTTETCGTVS